MRLPTKADDQRPRPTTAARAEEQHSPNGLATAGEQAEGLLLSELGNCEQPDGYRLGPPERAVRED